MTDTRPPVPTGPIITLVYRIKPERRVQLLQFLRDSFPLYERPGGCRMALYESVDEPGLVLELVAYRDEATYARDQVRVTEDPEMQSVLSAWRELVDGPIEVRRMRPL